MDDHLRDIVLDEHGAKNVSTRQELIGELDPNRSERQAIMEEHGSGMAIGTSRLIGEYDPNRTDVQAIMDEHGANAYVSKTERYGSEEEQEIEIMRLLSLSTSVNPEEIGKLVSNIPDASLYKVISKRFKDSANMMDDKWGLDKNHMGVLGERLYTDFMIILEGMNQNRDLNSKQMDASLYVGVEPTNIEGVLKSYQEYIAQVGQPILLWDFNKLSVPNASSEEMKADEMLGILRQKANEKYGGMEMEAIQKGI